MEIDFNAIRRDVSIQSVLSMFGKPYSEKKDFPCVSKEHDDKHPSMKIIHKSNRCFCYACNAVFDPVDLAAQELGCSKYDAVCYLIENLNLNKSDYVTLDEDMELPEKRFPYSNAEMAVLGLSMSYSFKTLTPKDNMTLMQISGDILFDDTLTKKLSKDELKEEIRFQETTYLMHAGRNDSVNMVRLFREHEEDFYGFVEMAAAKQIEKLETIKADMEKDFMEQKKVFYASGKKADRDRIVRNFLDYIKEGEAHIDIDATSAKILRAYIPLYDMHKDLKELDMKIEEINGLLDRIPQKYKTANFSLVDEVLDNVIPFERNDYSLVHEDDVMER